MSCRGEGSTDSIDFTHCLTLEGRLVDRSFYKDIALLASMASFVEEVMSSELTSKSFTISLLR